MHADNKVRARFSGGVLLAMLGLTVSWRGVAAAPPTAVPAAAVQVQIRNFMFEPMQVKIRAGSTVTWINRDDEPHTVVADASLFRSGALDTDMTFAFRFDRPGTYRIFCSIHPQMKATITVE